MTYSNCLVEALVAKVADWNNVNIRLYPLELNNNKIHFYWTSGDEYFHYTHKNKNERFLFKGETKSYRKGFFEGSLLSKMYNNVTIEQAVKLSKKYRLPFTKDDIEDYYKCEDLEKAESEA